MRSPHSSDNSCRTAAAGFPHLPLQVACLEVVEVPLPAAGLSLSCRRSNWRVHLSLTATSCRPSAPAAASSCRIMVEVPRSSRGASARYRSRSCRRSSWRVPLSLTTTSCRPSAPAATSCLPRNSRGTSARYLSGEGPPTGRPPTLSGVAFFLQRAVFTDDMQVWRLLSVSSRFRLCPFRICPVLECCATPVSFETGLPFCSRVKRFLHPSWVTSATLRPVMRQGKGSCMQAGCGQARGQRIQPSHTESKTLYPKTLHAFYQHVN